ncbi:hypothetical protein BU16DRAFT_545320 [Lophium mytilinum]|uniref:Uncharacterized protein n=1 Tax=Lophium mytilinum TaxID=390894 RepID=A0A6A6Q8G0_9PEZI|nr:hypothetical protein BU16DRAFT_545320 [Lophium mytilinum]
MVPSLRPSALRIISRFPISLRYARHAQPITASRPMTRPRLCYQPWIQPSRGARRGCWQDMGSRAPFCTSGRQHIAEPNHAPQAVLRRCPFLVLLLCPGGVVRRREVWLRDRPWLQRLRDTSRGSCEGKNARESRAARRPSVLLGGLKSTALTGRWARSRVLWALSAPLISWCSVEVADLFHSTLGSLVVASTTPRRC